MPVDHAFRRLHERPSLRRSGLVALARVAILWIVGATTLICVGTSQLVAQSDRQAVLAVATQFFDGMRARDTALMRSTAVPSTTLMLAGGPTGLQAPITISQFIGGVGSGKGPGGDERIFDPAIEIDGPMASLWAYYTYTRGGETQIDHCGVDAFLFRKGPDGWKIFNLAGTIRKEGCKPGGK